MSSNVRRIGIDARFYGSIGKGLGRYTQEVVDNIVKMDETNEYVIFLRKENFDEFKLDDGRRVRKVLAEVRWYSLAEQFIIPWLIWKEKIDLMHFPHFNVPVLCPAKFVVTIHDLILINFPTNRATTLGPVLYWIKNKGYRLVIWLALLRSRKIISVSHFTKKDILEHFDIKQEKIAVTYEGVADFAKASATSQENEAALLARFSIAKPYLLYVGNAYPHKNLEGLLAAFADLIKLRRDLRLVLVGKSDYFYEKIKERAMELALYGKGVNDPVIFAGFVNDRELESLFNNAEAYVFSSFYEGFGLPPLEAMAKGLPVVSSNAASMPEILGDAAAYFDPSDLSKMKQAIAEVLDSEILRKELCNKGFERVKQYSWQECARLTLEIYRKAFS
ncbi:glycosyltransferase family 4 protein [Candidatus Falkowbacteria bacterium]|nr:glycosyltransferase family 4 protein [Candidatus Falkowbacteria bacterium]